MLHWVGGCGHCPQESLGASNPEAQTELRIFLQTYPKASVPGHAAWHLPPLPIHPTKGPGIGLDPSFFHEAIGSSSSDGLSYIDPSTLPTSAAGSQASSPAIWILYQVLPEAPGFRSTACHSQIPPWNCTLGHGTPLPNTLQWLLVVFRSGLSTMGWCPDWHPSSQSHSAPAPLSHDPDSEGARIP